MSRSEAHPPPRLLIHSIRMPTASVQSYNCIYTLTHFDTSSKLVSIYLSTYLHIYIYIYQRGYKIRICFSLSLNFSIQVIISSRNSRNKGSDLNTVNFNVTCLQREERNPNVTNKNKCIRCNKWQIVISYLQKVTRNDYFRRDENVKKIK